jgi:hypothetical protein
MSFEDVKNGGPANWYVGTDEAMKSNRGDMGERGVKMSPAKFIEIARKDRSTIFWDGTEKYYDAIAFAEIEDDDDPESFLFRNYLCGHLDALRRFCPERLEK